MSVWIEKIKGHPCGVLLAAQLIAILAYPFASDTPTGRAILSVFGILVLALAVFAVRATPVHTWFALLVGVPVVVLTVLEAIRPGNEPIALASNGLHAVFYFYTAYGLVRYLFDDTWVTRDEIFAVGANFTVVAWAFAYVFMVVQIIWPGSFIAYSGEGTRSFLEMLYLSFANLTSVGLSDVYAVLPHGRSVAIVEQVAGVMYVALIIARIVGLTMYRFRG